MSQFCLNPSEVYNFLREKDLRLADLPNYAAKKTGYSLDKATVEDIRKRINGNYNLTQTQSFIINQLSNI
jgi:hypothetical protein